MELTIKKTAKDFEVTGSGRSAAWRRATWLPLARVGPGASKYTTRAKMLYSDKGLYFLVDCDDRRLTSTMTRENDDIYQEDVVEVFFQPDPKRALYFEYEISPMNVELTLVIPNQNGTFMGWVPWHYDGERRIRKATSVRGGPKKSMATVEGWTAEFFIPFALLPGIMPVAPKPGTVWKGNLYRIDYDEAPASHWAWCPETGPRFHTYKKFGRWVFGK